MKRLRLTAIERYVLIQTVGAVIGAMLIVSSVILLIDFVDVSQRLDLTFTGTAGMVAMKSPAVIVLVIPFMLLFGTLAAFVKLNRRSELVAMRAAGVSAWRFILPAAVLAFVFGVVTITALNPATAALTDRYERAVAAISEGRSRAEPKPIWLRQGDPVSQTVIHAASRASEMPGVVLQDVTFYQFALGRDGVMNFKSRIESQEASLHAGYWDLRDVDEATPGSGARHYDTMRVPTTLGRRDVERLSSPDAISFWDLPRVIDQTEQAGFSSLGYRLRLQQLLATPLLFAAMSILAAAFSLRLMRLGGLAVLATSGVALGFVFFFLNEFSGALGQAEYLPLFAAAWAPPLLALLSGLTLLCYTEDG
jgi:lipopolysaccharide export system permease protein